MPESFPPIQEPRPTTWDATSNVVDWLLAPLAPAPGVRQRRARLLAWMLVGILGLLGVAIVLTLLFGPAARIRANEYLGVVAALGLTLTLAYVVNAAGHYTAAAWMMIVPAATEPWIALLADPAILHGDFVPLMYVCVSVLLAGFLFSPRTTLVLAAAQFTGLLLIPVLVPSAQTFNWISALLLALMISALGLLMSSIVRRDLEELDMQAHQLAESEARMRELSTATSSPAFSTDVISESHSSTRRESRAGRGHPGRHRIRRRQPQGDQRPLRACRGGRGAQAARPCRCSEHAGNDSHAAAGVTNSCSCFRAPRDTQPSSVQRLFAT